MRDFKEFQFKDEYVQFDFEVITYDICGGYVSVTMIGRGVGKYANPSGFPDTEVVLRFFADKPREVSYDPASTLYDLGVLDEWNEQVTDEINRRLQEFADNA